MFVLILCLLGRLCKTVQTAYMRATHHAYAIIMHLHQFYLHLVYMHIFKAKRIGTTV